MKNKIKFNAIDALIIAGVILVLAVFGYYALGGWEMSDSGKEKIRQNEQSGGEIGDTADLTAVSAKLISHHYQHGIFQKIIIDRTEKLGDKQRYKAF